MDIIDTLKKQIIDLQKQANTLTSKIKMEKNPDRRGKLQKQLIDINTKKRKLNDKLDLEVSNIDRDATLDLNNESFKKLKEYRQNKQIRESIKSFINTLILKRNKK